MEFCGHKKCPGAMGGDSSIENLCENDGGAQKGVESRGQHGKNENSHMHDLQGSILSKSPWDGPSGIRAG